MYCISEKSWWFTVCSTCNDCGYMVFEDIEVMISAHVTDKFLKVKK